MITKRLKWRHRKSKVDVLEMFSAWQTIDQKAWRVKVNRGLDSVERREPSYGGRKFVK